MRSWRILITNDSLGGRTGTETVVRDLAFGLRAAGQIPMVYSPALGDLAREIRSAGIPVVSSLELVPEEPDIVQGNHHVETLQALLHFPKARGLFVCHHRTAYMAAPPRISRIRRYVAVDYHCLDRLIGDYGIPERLTRVIYNFVDTSRFGQRPPLPLAPQRALVFSNYARPNTHLEAVQDACALSGLPLDVIGSGSGNSCAAPELVLGRYDLVFAKARCALEAMAVGTAVVLCDTQGLGPMVTSSEFNDLRPWNFGMRVLREPLDPARIVKQVQRYNAADASAVGDQVRQHASLSSGLDQYLAVYDEIMTEPAIAATAAGELDEYVRATATRVHELETALVQFRRPFRMEPLSDAACERLALLIRDAPRHVKCGKTFQVEVELKNGSSERLGSYPPCPLHFSYRWFVSTTDEAVLAEGSRTPLRPSLPPAEKGSYSFAVVAPPEAGRYRLRLTLVQESVRWLDRLECPVSAETLLSVGPAEPHASPA